MLSVTQDAQQRHLGHGAQQLGVLFARCTEHAAMQVGGQERQVICLSHARDQPEPGICRVLNAHQDSAMEAVKDNAARQTIQHIGGAHASSILASLA